ITQIETIRVGEFPDLIWVQVHTDAGITGLGETWYAASGVQALVHDHFGPLLIGRDPQEVESHWTEMFKLSDHAGYGGAELRAISALDTALWDIKGQAAKRTVYELLGGPVRAKVPVYNTCGVYGEIQDGYNLYRDAGRVAKELLDEGVGAMKMSPTDFIALGSAGQLLDPVDLDWALGPIRRIREAVGMEMQVANDAHAKWNLPNAIRIVQAMEPYEIMWHEELLSPFNETAHLRLQESTKSPICVAERLMTRYQFRRFIENGSARIVMPDLVWTGGISETFKVAILASAHQIPVAPHDCTGPVNMFACAQVCMASPNVIIMESNRAMHRGWYGRFVKPNADIRDGFMYAPQEPGVGTRLRPEVRDRPDAVVQVSDQPREPWLTSRRRYTFPPPDIQAEGEARRKARRGGRE
ncbi:MAG: mandelate racemase/muconate lactonizing enzyme family protein, partial [Chloroflexi bacterium]|nr:mandelate racemase/muconate lactonizing enzyme family protein [Chloroflexota bacterium]